VSWATTASVVLAACGSGSQPVPASDPAPIAPAVAPASAVAPAPMELPEWAARLPRSLRVRIEGESPGAHIPRWGALAWLRLSLRREGGSILVEPRLDDLVGDASDDQLGMLVDLHRHDFVVDERDGRFVAAAGVDGQLARAIAQWWDGWMTSLGASGTQPEAGSRFVDLGGGDALEIGERSTACAHPDRECVSIERTLAVFSSTTADGASMASSEVLVHVHDALARAPAARPVAEIDQFAAPEFWRMTTEAWRDPATSELLFLRIALADARASTDLLYTPGEPPR
jgi:hypothetical protein